MCPRSSTQQASHTFTGEDIGTRYVALPLRILVNPNDPADLDAVHALQDAVTVANRTARAASRSPTGIR